MIEFIISLISSKLNREKKTNVRLNTSSFLYVEPRMSVGITFYVKRKLLRDENTESSEVVIPNFVFYSWLHMYADANCDCKISF